MNNYVEYAKAIVSGLCLKPDEVEVAKAMDELGVLLTVKVSPEDVGRLIGRQGRTAEAIRLLVRLAGYNDGARVSLKIRDPETVEN